MTRMRDVVAFAALVAALLSAAPVAAEEQKQTVTIAVRTDARPFAWQVPDSPQTFGGYLVDICTDATTRAGFHYQLAAMDAAQREAILDGNFQLDNQPVDLVCDPTTITLGRLDKLAGNPATSHAVFSPILFVANGSYVQRATALPCSLVEPPPSGTQDCAPKFPAEVGRTLFDDPNCISGPASESSENRSKEYLVAGFVRGATARRTIEQAVRTGRIRLKQDQNLCLYEVPAHTEGVKLLCSGALHFYFGDIDIIEAYRAEQPDRCDITVAEAPLSYEPYALLVPSAKTEFRAKFIAAVYEIFSDGTAAGRFSHHFRGLEESTALTTLFRINSIPSHRTK